MVAPAVKAGEESPSSIGQGAGEMPGGVIRGKWHRNYTADGPSRAQARVKWWGKSPPASG